MNIEIPDDLYQQFRQVRTTFSDLYSMKSANTHRPTITRRIR